jgi:hypothetical protein
MTPVSARSISDRDAAVMMVNVRFGSQADIRTAKSHVRFTPNNDRESGFPQPVMSALRPKADMCSATRDVRYGPIADMHKHETESPPRDGLSKSCCSDWIRLPCASFATRAKPMRRGRWRKAEVQPGGVSVCSMAARVATTLRVGRDGRGRAGQPSHLYSDFLIELKGLPITVLGSVALGCDPVANVTYRSFENGLPSASIPGRISRRPRSTWGSWRRQNQRDAYDGTMIRGLSRSFKMGFSTTAR